MSGNGANRALELLRSLPRVSLANLRPNPGSKKPVSACSLCRVGPGGRIVPRQRPGVVCPRGCQKDIVLARPGEWPGQDRRGKAEDWMALLCVCVGIAVCVCWPAACPLLALWPSPQRAGRGVVLPEPRGLCWGWRGIVKGC